MVVKTFTKTSFATGQITKNLLGRTDTQAYGSGLKTALNCYVTIEGQIRKRPGTRHIAPLFLNGKGRLISYGDMCIVLGADYFMVYINGIPFVNKKTATITYDATQNAYSITNARQWDILRQGIRYVTFQDDLGNYSPEQFSKIDQPDIEKIQTITDYQNPAVGEYETIYKFEFGTFEFTEPYSYEVRYSTFNFLGVEHTHSDWVSTTRNVYNDLPTDKLNYFIFNGQLVVYLLATDANLQKKMLTFKAITIIDIDDRPPDAYILNGNVLRYGDRNNVDYHSFSRGGVKVGEANFTKTSKSGVGTPQDLQSVSSFNTIYQQRLVLIHDSNSISFSKINDYSDFTNTPNDPISGFSMKFDSEFMITCVGQLHQYLIVGSNSAIYKVSNDKGSFTINAAESFSVDKISSIGLAPITPVLHNNSLICVLNDRSGLISINYAPNMGMSVNEIADTYELFKEYGGIRSLEVLIWGHAYLICNTSSGQLIILNISDTTSAPCPWKFDHGYVKEFCVTRQDSWSDVLYLIIMRDGLEYLEMMTRPVDLISKEQWFNRYLKTDIGLLDGTALAQQRATLEDFYYRYWGQVTRANTFCDSSVMIDTHRNIDLEFDGNDLLSVKPGFDPLTGNAVKKDYFTKDMEYNGYFEYNGSIYEAIEYIDSTKMRVLAGKKDTPHWEALNGSCNFVPYTIKKLEHLYSSSPNITMATTASEPTFNGNEPIHMPVDYFAKGLEVSITGEMKLNNSNYEMNIGFPYKTLIVTNPVMTSGDIFRKKGLSLGVAQCLQTGPFKVGANIHEVHDVKIAEIDEIQYFEFDVAGTIKYGCRLVVESVDPVNLRILAITATEKSS